ncbi:unnamed protein product, partial [Leptidea sinapis]
RKKRVDPHNRS